MGIKHRTQLGGPFSKRITAGRSACTPVRRSHNEIKSPIETVKWIVHFHNSLRCRCASGRFSLSGVFLSRRRTSPKTTHTQLSEAKFRERNIIKGFHIGSQTEVRVVSFDQTQLWNEMRLIFQNLDASSVPTQIQYVCRTEYHNLDWKNQKLGLNVSSDY